MKETELFLNPTRAQLTTTAFKPCTYFATQSDGTRVFVKGPFPSQEEAAVAGHVSRVKELLTRGGITTNNPTVTMCLPDGGTDCQFGVRTTVVPETEYPFQVTHNVLQGETWPLPTKKKSSAKAWPVPVEVVDWEKLERWGHVEYNRAYSKSIYKTDSVAAVEFVKHIFLSWVVGAGADLAYSNFVYDKERHTVMQVDNDLWLKHDWWITDTRVGSKRTKAYDQMVKFLGENKEVFDGFFSTMETSVIDNREALLEELGVENYNVVCGKILSLRENWETASDTWKGNASKIKSAAHLLDQKRPREEVDDLEQKKPKKTKLPPPAPLVRQEAIPMYTPDDIFIGKCNTGYRVAVDPWGYSITLRKSDFQKAIRRGNAPQALVAFFVCYNMEQVFPTESTAKSIRTNILNRLVICAMEDIGVANHRLVNTVTMVVDDILEKRKGDPCYGNRVDVKQILAKLIYNMCASTKTRIQSHMSHAYKPCNVDLALKHGLTWSADPISVSQPEFIRVLESDHTRAWDLFKIRVHPAYYNAWKRFTAANKNAVVRYLFAVFHFLTTAAIEDDEPFTSRCYLVDIPKEIDTSFFKNQLELPPQECANDMHVSGTKTQEEKIKFRTEGAMVDNEDYRFNNMVYKYIYIHSRA